MVEKPLCVLPVHPWLWQRLGHGKGMGGALLLLRAVLGVCPCPFLGEAAVSSLAPSHEAAVS